MTAWKNIILIQSDQHRGDWLGSAGADFIHSPHLDALASRGVSFRNTYCSYPLCGPSRMSFLTGRHPYRNGMFTNEESLASHLPTYAHALGLAGFHTVLCGRMHFCGVDQRHGFVERIFGDYNASYPGGPIAEMPKELRQASAGRKACIDHVKTSEHNYFIDFDEGVTCAAEAYLSDYAQQGEQAPPLALNVGFFLPHTPFAAPEKYVARARERAGTMPQPIPRRADMNAWEASFLTQRQTESMKPEDFQEARIQYAAMIDYLDERIGRVLHAAEALHGETLVVYWSDHGELAGDHQLVTKGNLNESSIHVPMIWSPLKPSAEEQAKPAIQNPGRLVNAPASLLDIAATLADYCEPSEEWRRMPALDGVSLRPYLEDRSTEKLDERAIFTEVEMTPDPGPARMVRRGAYKYIYYHQDRDALFNLELDPGEQRNLIDEPEHSGLVEDLRTQVLTGWDPVYLQSGCEESWKIRPFIVRWGQQVGAKHYGLMDVWPG